MAEEHSMEELKRKAAEQRERHSTAAKDDMDYLEALQRESRRRTGQLLSPEVTAALILRHAVLRSNLG